LREQALVEIVGVEDALLGSTVQDLSLLLHFLCVVPAAVIHMVIVEVLLLNVWYEGGLERFLTESIPVEVFEKWMLFNLKGPLHTKTLGRLPLQTLVNEIGGLASVASW